MKFAQKLFDARSPFWQMALATLFVSCFALFAHSYANTNPSSSTGGFEIELVDIGGYYILLAVLSMFLLISASLSVKHYNKRHPKQKKLSVWQIHPPEMLTNDEMLTQASLTAASRVYLYNNIALPILVVAVLFWRMYPLGLGAVLITYLIGYYLTYLVALWPYLGED